MGRPLLFTLLLLAAACKSSPKDPAPAAERVVLEPLKPDPAYAPKQPAEWYDAQILAAQAAFEEERYADALQILYATRAQNPAPKHLQAVFALLRAVNRAVLDLETIEITAEPLRDPIPFGDGVVFLLHFRNPGTRPVHIPARLDERASILALDVERREHDVRGQVVITRKRVHRPLEEDLEVPVGGEVRLAVDLGPLGNDRPLEGIRIYVVSGLLRPARLDLGRLRRWDAVRVRPGSLRSFRPNWEHLAADPPARVLQALEKRAPLHLLTACALLERQQRAAAVDALLAALGGEARMDFAVYASLQVLTGEDLGREPGPWRVWWPRVRETFFAPPPERSEGPVFSED